VIKIETTTQYQNYRAQSINTMTREELLILLYDELILNINKAMYNIKKRKTADAHNNIIKAENIVIYLIDILNVSYDLAHDLLQIYEYIYRQLIEANVHKNEEVLQKILPLVIELKNTWQQAAKEIRQQAQIRDVLHG